jgi:RTX calcium-binding nonapeptide repeat (4 copies)
VASPGTVTIDLNSDIANPADFDSYLRLFDANGQELAFNDDDGTDSFSKITQTLTPGTYYAGVSGFSNTGYDPTVAGSGIAGATGNYSLQFGFDNPDPNGTIAGAVEVNLGNDREPLFFNGLIGADYGKPVGTSDVDLFKLVIPDNGTLFVDIDTPYDSGYVDSYLRLFDADGNELFFAGTSDPFASDNDLSFNANKTFTEFTDTANPGLVFEDPTDRQFYQGHTSDSFLGVIVERGETYYIGVSDFQNTNYDSTTLTGRPAVGTGGQYDLKVAFVSNDQNGSITQALDSSIIPLPVTGQPGTIGSDTNFKTGDLVEVGDRDVDFVKVNSGTAGILEIDINSYTDSSITDPVDTAALLFDADGKLLASDDDTDSLDPLLQYQIDANTDYYVAIAGYGNTNFDPFQLGSGSSGPTGRYIFNSRVLPLSQVGVLSNDLVSSGAVQDVAIGSNIPANVGKDNGFVVGASDIDLYRLTPTTSGQIRIQSSATEEFSADTYLRFFDASGNQLAANDNQNSTNRGSSLDVSVAAGATYYVGVNGASPGAGNYNPLTGTGAAPGSQGDYRLLLSQVPTPTPTPPTPTPPTPTPPIPTPPIPTPVNLTGTPDGEALIGNENNNQIDGGGGNDQLSGLGGDDKLIGGSGADLLTGGAGADRFIFKGGTKAGALTTSSPAAPDTVTDFSFSQGDKFQLDFDDNLETIDLPKGLFNSGREKARKLSDAVKQAYGDKNQRKQGNQRLKANEAVIFGWRGRTYLVVNDRSPSFSPARDLVSDITGIELKAGNAKTGVLAVTDYFA